MKKNETRREHLIEIMAEYILINGIENATLRNLAQAAETSDRMLLHYFKDKEDLLVAALSFIAEKFIVILEKNRSEKMVIHELIPHLYQAIKNPQLKPYITLWLELSALASKKEEPFYSAAREIEESFSGWIDQAIKVEKEEEREQIAALALATVEGFVILDALDYDTKIIKAIEGIKILSEVKKG